MAHRPIGMILSAGYGTRLYPLNELRPKPLMEVLGKPIIFYLIKMMENAGIKDVILNVHHRSEQIRKTLSRYVFKCRVHLVYEKEILNTAGGVANALRKLSIANRKMVLIHGDILCHLDLAPFLLRDDFLSLICEEGRLVSGYQGSVSINDAGRVVELGKFYSSSIPVTKRGFFTGIQVLSTDALERIKARSRAESLVATVYPVWLKEGLNVQGIIMPLFYDDLGTKERVFDANMKMLKIKTSSPLFEENPAIKKISDGIFVDDTSRIDKTVKLNSPVYIASSAVIESHAEIGPYVVIGERAIVKSHAQIKNSVVMSETIIEKDESVDCMIALNSARVLVKN